MLKWSPFVRIDSRAQSDAALRSVKMANVQSKQSPHTSETGPTADLWVRSLVFISITVGMAPILDWSWSLWSHSALGGGATAVVAIPIALILGGIASRHSEHIHESPSQLAGILLALSMMMATVMIELVDGDGPWLLAAGTLFIGSYFLWFCWSWGLRKATSIAMPLSFLLLVLPWEYYLRSNAQLTLQSWTADLSILLLEGMGFAVWHYNSFTIDSQRYYLIINETCSGINMLVALFMYTLVFTWIARSFWATRLTLLVLVFPIAMLANTIRVTCIYLLGYYGGVEWADGFWHSGSAYVLFIPIFGLIYFLNRGLDTRFRSH